MNNNNIIDLLKFYINYIFNIKLFVQDMVISPTNNHGLMLRHQDESNYRLTSLTSSDDTNPAKRPKIEVYYHLPY